MASVVQARSAVNTIGTLCGSRSFQEDLPLGGRAASHQLERLRRHAGEPSERADERREERHERRDGDLRALADRRTRRSRAGPGRRSGPTPRRRRRAARRRRRPASGSPAMRREDPAAAAERVAGHGLAERVEARLHEHGIGLAQALHDDVGRRQQVELDREHEDDRLPQERSRPRRRTSRRHVFADAAHRLREPDPSGRARLAGERRILAQALGAPS